MLAVFKTWSKEHKLKISIVYVCLFVGSVGRVHCHINKFDICFLFVFCKFCGVVVCIGVFSKMSNKRNKELENHESDSEEEQNSGDEKDSDLDSEGNYVGEKVRWREYNLKTHG